MNTEMLFRVWIRASIALAAAFIIWNYVPILVPLGIIVGALALFAIGVRWIAARYRRPDPGQD